MLSPLIIHHNICYIYSNLATDSCGEKLAWLLGITSPKYQYAIDEFHRLKKEVGVIVTSLADVLMQQMSFN